VLLASQEYVMAAAQIHLELVDAAELAEALTFISQWLAGPTTTNSKPRFAASWASTATNSPNCAPTWPDSASCSATTTASNSSLTITRPAGTPATTTSAARNGARFVKDRGPVQCWDVMVTDLHHLRDLPADAPGPARRLAEHLGNIVRAATAAGDPATAWESALPYRRRPANRRCPGRITLAPTQPEGPIRWRCSTCDDEGIISNWQDSPFDLRRRRLTLTGAVHEIVISNEVAAALRALQLLDPHCERLVFAIRAHRDGAVLAVTDDDLEELIGFVAAEANHEPNRRRQQRLDAAFEALNTAAQTLNGW
jgi:hypothetical protein